MKIFAFNGCLFAQRQTGVMRYAREILLKLDILPNARDYELVVPLYAENIPNLKNIQIIKYGRTKGILWEQADFYKYVNKNDRISVNFNNTFPILKPGIVFIHDIAYKLHPEFGASLHGKISNIYHRIIFWIASRGSLPIVTVSHFSKYQLVDFYKVDPHRVTVIGSAWQQMNDIKTDDSILHKYNLENCSYYFSLGSLSKMKNTIWFMDVAKNNPKCTFVLAGAKSLATKQDFELPENVKLVGFVSDEQVKSLLKHCKAFIYPSIYDGFGLPPLEALSQGANVICSNAASLTEVYGNTVHYIDPYDTKIDIDKVLSIPVCDASFTLDKYSWEKSAQELYKLLETYGEKLK